VPLPTYREADYLAGLQGLLPQGPAWPRDKDAVWTGLLAAWAPAYQRSGAAAVGLVGDLFPATTVSFLPEWEATLGLPDGCTPLNQVTAQRQAAVVSRFTARGGQSVPYFAAIAGALGVTASIEEHGLFRVGASAVGDAIAADAWAHAWTVQVHAESVTYFEVGSSSVGDPLLSVSDGGLACLLGRLAPAHTTLTVSYAPAGSTPAPSPGPATPVTQLLFTLDKSLLDGPDTLAAATVALPVFVLGSSVLGGADTLSSGQSTPSPPLVTPSPLFVLDSSPLDQGAYVLG
jgi:uncharacterized protein YmfQ (DUF2313 family)